MHRGKIDQRSLYFDVGFAQTRAVRSINSFSFPSPLSLFQPFSFSTYFQIPVHNSVMVAVVNAFQDLLNTVRGVSLAVEFPSDDVLEQFPAGNSVSVLRFNSISCRASRNRMAGEHAVTPGLTSGNKSGLNNACGEVSALPPEPSESLSR